eukprot:scaffold27275_cov17-Tisochrysis_lutea.AAC.1
MDACAHRVVLLDVLYQYQALTRRPPGDAAHVQGEEPIQRFLSIRAPPRRVPRGLAIRNSNFCVDKQGVGCVYAVARAAWLLLPEQNATTTDKA